MKNYIIIFLIVVIIVIGSFYYKTQKKLLFTKFPLIEDKNNQKTEGDVLNLYVFFSKQNCHSCLQFIETLNNLPEYYKVIGLVPKDELINETELRLISRAEFPLISNENYSRYFTSYIPMIFGVDKHGNILFILPGLSDQTRYLLNFLENTYNSAVIK